MVDSQLIVCFVKIGKRIEIEYSALTNIKVNEKTAPNNR